MQIDLGKIIDNKYRVEQKIGEGATSIVYKAFDLDLKKFVALKILRLQFMERPSYRKRFLREASIGAHFVHPFAISVKDICEWENTLYIVMDYEEGITLEELLQKKRRLPRKVISCLMKKLLCCLGEAHRQKILHRDIKPANLLIVLQDPEESKLEKLREGKIDALHLSVKILDFGLAGFEQEEFSQYQIEGTLPYMAPEQLLKDHLDSRCDLYACAVCVYRMVTGFLPVRGDNLEDHLSRMIHKKLYPPSYYRSEIHSTLDRVLLKALSIAPEDRYDDCDEFAQELESALKKTNHHWKKKLTFVAIFLICLGLGIFFLHQNITQRQNKAALEKALLCLEKKDYEEARKISHKISQAYPLQSKVILLKSLYYEFQDKGKFVRNTDLSFLEDPVWKEHVAYKIFRDYLLFYHKNLSTGEKNKIILPKRLSSLLKKQSRRWENYRNFLNFKKSLREKKFEVAEKYLRRIISSYPQWDLKNLYNQLEKKRYLHLYRKYLKEKKIHASNGASPPFRKFPNFPK